MKAKKTLNVYQLHISLSDISPPVWRDFQVPGSFTLWELHDVILAVMGWDGSHLHSFTIDKKEYGPQHEGMMFFEDDEKEDEDEYTLDSLGLQEKQKFQYLYDFGDDWFHEITVLKILPAAECPPEDRKNPRCLKGERACPPEDCGGFPGYYDILEALEHPRKKASRELLEWLGDEYDPGKFDLEAVNELFSGD